MHKITSLTKKNTSLIVTDTIQNIYFHQGIYTHTLLFIVADERSKYRGMMKLTPAETKHEAEDEDMTAEMSTPYCAVDEPVTQHCRSVGPTQ